MSFSWGGKGRTGRAQCAASWRDPGRRSRWRRDRRACARSASGKAPRRMPTHQQLPRRRHRWPAELQAPCSRASPPPSLPWSPSPRSWRSRSRRSSASAQTRCSMRKAVGVHSFKAPWQYDCRFAQMWKQSAEVRQCCGFNKVCPMRAAQPECRRSRDLTRFKSWQTSWILLLRRASTPAREEDELGAQVAMVDTLAVAVGQPV